MSTQPSFITWLRHPGSIVLIIAVVLMFVVMTEQSRRQPQQVPISSTTGKALPSMPSTAPNAAAGSAPSAPAGKPAKMGGELPRIVRQFSAPAAPVSAGDTKTAGAPGRLQAPDLGSLLGRLEDKVKAEPENMGNRLLLAQTYNELGLADKALNEARAARAQDPAHARAKLVLASILSARDNAEGLQEAKGLLEELKTDDGTKQYLVAMYLGDTSIRMGDHDAALSYWQQAVDTMPVSDNRRPAIEKRIADLSARSAKKVQ
jgi:tetratricopeptide (TPR) repeat protein